MTDVFLRIFNYAINYFAILPQARNQRGRGRPPLPFFKNWKNSAPILGKDTLIVVIYGLHFFGSFKSFQEKQPKILHCGAFLSCVVYEIFIEVPSFQVLIEVFIAPVLSLEQLFTKKILGKSKSYCYRSECFHVENASTHQ